MRRAAMDHLLATATNTAACAPFEVVLAQFETGVAPPERGLGSVLSRFALLCALMGAAYRPSFFPLKHHPRSPH